MKISGPGQIQSKAVGKKDRKSQTDGAAFTKAVSGAEDTKETAHVSGASPLSSVDALLALQEVPDATAGRSKGLARASQMIDLLEDIRRGLLLGSIPVSRLAALAAAARHERGSSGDAALDSVLQDIELRAEVELAKLGQ